MPTQKTKPKGKINKQKEIEKKKRSRRKKRLMVLLILIVVIIIVAYLLTSPSFDIQKVTITGNEQLTQEKIMEMAELKIGDNIFSKLGIVIKVKLKRNGYIQDAKIYKKYPNQIEIEITERKKQYQIKTENESYIYIDEQGYVLECAKEKLELPTIIGMEITENEVGTQKRLNEKDLNKMENVLQIREQCKRIGINDSVTQIQVEDEYILSLENEGITINLGDGSNLKNRMDYVEALLKQEEGNNGTIYVNGNLNEGFLPYFSAN